MESVPAKPRILRIFISYAHEDAKIAIAVSNALHAALGDTLADVFLDKVSLEAGFEFKTQIEDRLDDTDILLIIYTGVEKPSHSYTGWEVGYFRGVQRRGSRNSDIERRIIPLYLYGPPATVAGVQGIALGITRETLSMSEADFISNLAVTPDNSMVKFLGELKDILDNIREQGGYPKGLAADTVKCVRDMLIEIFSYLKTTVDKILKPQKQITIKTSVVSLQATDGNLPSDAQLVPVGSGSPMSIFGLPEASIQWSTFISQVLDHKLGDSWREAINSVVTSSLPNHIDVDNSQIIVSSDERHVYRVILTTSTTYFNGNKEFNLYLVEALRPMDYGNRDTTLLLKGLDLVCRFRFMFLENNSEFYSKNILAISSDRLPGLARRIVRELNLLKRDAREAGLDQPNVWSEFVSWDTILNMSKEWEPREKKLREIAALIGRHEGHVNELGPLRNEFAALIDDLEQTIRPQNKLLIEQMSEKLRQIVNMEHEQA